MRPKRLLFLLLAVPLLAADVTLVGAGYVSPIPIKVAPGQVTTFFLTGIQFVLPQPAKASTVPLPTALAGISATVRQTLPQQKLPVPIFSVSQTNLCSPGQSGSACVLTAVMVQVPPELFARNPAVLSPIAEGITDVVFSANGSASAAFVLSPVLDNIHVITNCDPGLSHDFGGLPCQSVVTHADGTPVTASNPAKAGEIVIAYAFGLGKEPKLSLQFGWIPNAPPSRPQLAPGYGPAGAAPLFAGLAPGFVGLYQINFAIPTPPAGAPACGAGIDSNVTVRIQGLTSYDGARLCVDLGSAR